ncbi:response regulator [Pseudomonas sp. MT-1]|nr:response regulator [Pseudomonas sp. MT-1]
MLLLGVPYPLAAAEHVTFIDTRQAPSLEVGAVHFSAGRGEAGFDQARANDWAWQPLHAPHLGRRTDGAWVRFALHNSDATTTQLYLLLKWAGIDRATLRVYYPQRQHWSAPMTAGDSVPMSQRPIADQHLVFPLDLKPGERAVVYLRLQTGELMLLPMALVDEAGLFEGRVIDTALFSLFFGGMLVIVLYNLSLLVFTRDLSYLLYVLYLVSAMFYVATMSGIGQLLLWPEAPPMTSRFYALSATLCFLTPLLFVVRFLGVRQYGGWVWRVTWILGCYWTLLCLVILFAPTHAHWLQMEYVALPYCLISLAVTLNLWMRGNNSARLFSIAWVTLLGFTVVHLLALWGYMPLNRWTLYGQLIGMFIEFVLLSMALAERINQERAQRVAAQHNALQASQALVREREQRLQAQQQALEMQIRNNEALEARVYERTRALEEAKRGLERVNEQLTRMSVTDALTQLSNRGHFDLMIDEEIRRAQRTETPLSVLLLDIDHFKRVNDTYGHAFGDDCLRLVADTLRQHGQRAGDVVARYGGEEFVIALPGMNSREAGEQAERIRAAVAALRPVHGEKRLELSISIGVATLQPPANCTPTQLLATADGALYRAKHNGRNQVAIAEADEALEPSVN